MIQEKVKQALTEYADEVLRLGRNGKTPIFADGVHVESGKPVSWRFTDGREVPVANLTNQQNMFRALCAISKLTGDNRYEDALKESLRYYFEHLQDEGGLLYMGGHHFVDFETGEHCGIPEKGEVHELKDCFPFYELMFEVDEKAARRYIEGFWNAHVYQWDRLEISRHGQYGLEVKDVWKHEYNKPETFFESSGLSFLNAGNDLIYSAGMLSAQTGDEEPLIWAKRLVQQYVDARHPATGVGGYQFSRPRKTMDTTDDNETRSFFGDRASRQLGPEFGDIALEGNLLLPNQANCMCYHNVVMQLHLAELLGDKGTIFAEHTLNGYEAYLKNAYDWDNNTFRPMWSDGTDLSGFALKRNGYYGPAGRTFEPSKVGVNFLYSALRAYRYSGKEIFWKAARNIAKHNGLGDIGVRPGESVALDMETDNAAPLVMLAARELYLIAKDEEYSRFADRLAENMLATRTGCFWGGVRNGIVRFDQFEPYALAAYLDMYTDGKSGIPTFMHSNGYIHGDFRKKGGTVCMMKNGENFYSYL